ncbi:MAG: AMP-binding protein [Clostridia bacterium]|nr:AMP-binding protein [Clostridia bacterium]
MSKDIYFKAKDFNNIKEIVYNSADVYGDNIAFVIKNKVKGKVDYKNITYKKFLEEINCLGTSFYSLGLRGKRVAVIGKNRYEWVLAHLSNLLGSIVSVPLDKDLQLDELESSLIRSGVEAIVFDKKLVEIISEIKKRNSTNIKEFICMEECEGFSNVPELVKKGRKIIKEGNREYIDNEINNNEMNIMLFTSGTTSKSKAVMLSQRNVASNVYAIASVEDIRSTDTNIAFLPFHHIMGSTILVLTLSAGVKNVFPDGLRYIKDNLKEYEVSLFVGVPVLTEAIYNAVWKGIDKQGKAKLVKSMIVLSNLLLKFNIDIRRKLFKQVINELGGKLRLVVSGGAPADKMSIKGFNDFGITTLQGYGLSETAPVIAVENFKKSRYGSVGVPVINDTIEIVNKDENGIGEIRVKGPNVMLGYYEMPEKTAEVLKDGWFYTGDLGYYDKDGYLFVTGRSKNMIVLKNGKKVFPEEIETVVNRIDLVSECMVFGLQDKKDKNDLTLSVKVVYDEETIKEKYYDKTEEELRQIVWDKIKEVNMTFPKYKHIQNLITTREELIKTTTKKVKRQEEMKLILAGI